MRDESLSKLYNAEKGCREGGNEGSRQGLKVDGRETRRGDNVGEGKRKEKWGLNHA